MEKIGGSKHGLTLVAVVYLQKTKMEMNIEVKVNYLGRLPPESKNWCKKTKIKVKLPWVFTSRCNNKIEIVIVNNLDNFISVVFNIQVAKI